MDIWSWSSHLVLDEPDPAPCVDSDKSSIDFCDWEKVLCSYFVWGSFSHSILQKTKFTKFLTKSNTEKDISFGGDFSSILNNMQCDIMKYIES